MPSLNKILLMGNVGKDADLRYSKTGSALAGFSLAVNNRKRGDNGEWEDQTEWFNIRLFGDTAEKLSQYITKGKPIYVEGRLQTRTWDDQEGVKRTSIEVLANSIQLLGGRDDADGDSPAPRQASAPKKKANEGWDDLPFE